MIHSRIMNIGATYLGNGHTEFTVWAPLKEKMILHIVDPFEKETAMQKDEQGCFHATEKAEPGTKYFFKIDGKDIPDPASKFPSAAGPARAAPVALETKSCASRQAASLSRTRRRAAPQSGPAAPGGGLALCDAFGRVPLAPPGCASVHSLRDRRHRGAAAITWSSPLRGTPVAAVRPRSTPTASSTWPSS